MYNLITFFLENPQQTIKENKNKENIKHIKQFSVPKDIVRLLNK